MDSLYLVSLVYYNIYYENLYDNSDLPVYLLDKDLVDSFYSLSSNKGPELQGIFNFSYPKFAYEYNSLKNIDNMDDDKKDDLLNTKKSCVLTIKFNVNHPFDNLLFSDLYSATKFINIILNIYDSDITVHSGLFKTYKGYIDYIRFNSMPGSFKSLNKLNRVLSNGSVGTDIPAWIIPSSHYLRGLLGRILVRKVNLNTADSGNNENGLNSYKNLFEDKPVSKGETPVIEYVRYMPKKFIGVNPVYTDII